ncbi:CPBP family intramembrane metalloprotease [Aquibacillus koreensis]|uniref:CPBP family intramembrane metalloprotease n=1 Tax=Aquibacillus koreensis TaxID=279446 RepID=A0A9X3WRQ6_9BACI|nr:CPBP family intramembrane glutamic endopeptidase [Aquibacillus koreensis]MCT2535371.1 CPBP family intramembrane metalloprotease [Aquibacillus koreensis]MDC3422536.1 CPBP family intramembrane metalloprotease [Aquibacillus koreensis]
MKEDLKPMYFGESLLLFGIPGIILYCNIYYGVPYLDSLGVPLIISFPLALYGLLFLLFIASLIAYKLEGNPSTLAGLTKRFRLTKLNKKMGFISIGTFIVVMIMEELLKFTSGILAKMSVFAPPDILPEFIDPNQTLSFPLTAFMGVSLEGNWWILLVWLLCLACNILGEEFWWRGYILPRQELAFGKKAWLVHGALLLLVFHAFLKWNYIVLIPICFILPYMAQRYQNTWIPAIIHGIGNGLFFAFIIPGIF